MKGAKTSLRVSFPRASSAPTAQLTRGTDIVPRRLYLKPADFRKYGFTQGCPGCTHAQTNIGPKRNHSEACRHRMESEIAKNNDDERTGKVRERHDHFLAKRIEESDDPRHGGVEEPELTTAQPQDIEEDINEDDTAEMFMDDGDDLDSLNAKAENTNIVYHTILGHDLTDSYSNGRLQLARARHTIGQLAAVDISEVFSPERVRKLCKSYGLEPGQVMDIKNGYNFDHAGDRKRAWESVVKDKPKLRIGSQPCAFFSRLQELNQHMYRNHAAWTAKFHGN